MKRVAVRIPPKNNNGTVRYFGPSFPLEKLSYQACTVGRSNPQDKALSYWTTVLDAMSKPDYAMGWLKGEFGAVPK